MKHVTQGRIDRYVNRALSLYGASRYFEWAATQPPVLGRRAMLKALRDFMTPKRNHKQRHYRRSLESWTVPAFCEAPPTQGFVVPEGQYRVQLRASGKSEAFADFISRKAGYEVSP